MPRKWNDYKNFERMERRAESLSSFEKMRKGKRSVRGRTVDDWLIDPPGSSEDEVEAAVEKLLESGHILGRVIEVHKRGAFVAEEPEFKHPETGLVWFCSIAKRHFQRAHRERNFVVVGDRVILSPGEGAQDPGEPGAEPETDLPRGAIQHGFRRTSRIARKDPLNPDWEHVMLANVDQLAIVASVLNPTIRWGLIDRFLVQAELEKLPVFVVVNKIDLLDDERIAGADFVEECRTRIAAYRHVGYDVYELSALHPKRNVAVLEALRQRFKGHITGLCGHSGVGKSSVVNLMDPEFEQIVDENPEIFYKGRHTTTYNSMLRLGIGGYAIDTPGIRSFAIERFDPLALADAFPEFRRYRCRYRECRHDREQECAVREGLARGEFLQGRYRSYIGLLRGVSEREGELGDELAELKADLEARRQGSSDAVPEPREEQHDAAHTGDVGAVGAVGAAEEVEREGG